MSEEKVINNNEETQDSTERSGDDKRRFVKDGARGPRRDNNGGGFKGGKKKSFFAKKVCKFTTNQIDPATIDYKNVELLKRFIMPSGKIVPRRITGTSSKYQRVLACEIKKARIMAFLPFSAR
ncbi:MAG: 30S ribosomal protein S18 [Brevinema sp.]